MRHHRDAFAAARARPDMMLTLRTFDGACNYVSGYDCACLGGVLEGFDALMTRKGAPTRGAWRERVLTVAFPDAADARASLEASTEAQRHAIELLFDLISELDDIHTKRYGLRELLTGDE